MDPSVLRTLIDETVRRTLAKMAAPRPIPGTVFDADSELVLIDGDVDPVYAPSISGPLVTGQRVMVLFYPPAGAMVIGRIGGAPTTKVEPFEVIGGVATNYDWVKESGAGLIEVIFIGGAGGGGTGRSDAAATLRPGGGGGGGGGYTHLILPASMFGDGETVFVGQGGAGGVNPGAAVANGTAGTAGTASWITLSALTANTGESIAIVAAGGGGGGGGTATAGGSGGAGGRGLIQGMRGGKASDIGGIGLASHTWRTNEASVNYPQSLVSTVDFVRGPPGGGSGGGLTTGNVGADGGPGLIWAPLGTVLPAAAGQTGVPSGIGSDGPSMPPGLWLGGGSGSGGAPFGGPPPTSGGAGGNGGNYGAGGGGGSGKSSGSVVGNGGDGSPGIAVIITHFDVF